MIIMVAKTGRLIERSLRNIGSALPSYDLDRITSLHTFGRADDRHFSRIQSLGDLGQTTGFIGQSHGHVPPRDFSAFDHEDIALVAVSPDTRARNRQRAP